MANTCTHMDQIEFVELPETIPGCEECLVMGARWLHLRMCTSCGHIGCCDSSPTGTRRRTCSASGHPVIRSAEPGEDWFWCYEDEVAFTVAPPAAEGP